MTLQQEIGGMAVKIIKSPNAKQELQRVLPWVSLSSWPSKLKERC